MTTETTTTSDVRLRKPTRADGARIHAFVRDSSLETNTRYGYLLLASHFRDTGVIAERDGALVGFISGYRLPRRPDTVFVWQVGVAPSERRTGLGKRMLAKLVRQLDSEGVRCLEATVGSENAASARLFESLARKLGTSCSRLRGFESQDFGDEVHEDEVLFRVGPWETS